LKDLLPECKYVNTTKATILECAVKSLQRLQALCNTLLVQNKALLKDNKRLRAELAKTSPSFRFEEDESTLNEFGGSLDIPGVDVGEIDTLLGTNEGTTSNYEDYSSPSSSFDSPESPFSTVNPDYSFPFERDPFYKISKRRLLLVFLFLLPFFSVMSRENIFSPFQNGSNTRILNGDSSQPVETDPYSDSLRMIWFAMVACIGIAWLARTLLWMHGLGKYAHSIWRSTKRNLSLVVQDGRTIST